MKTATVSDFRANMKEHLEEVQRDQDVLILSGPKKKDFVLITLEQYNAMEETAYLQSTPANAARLMESIEQDKSGAVPHSFQLKPAASEIADSMKIKPRKHREVVDGKRSVHPVSHKGDGRKVSKHGKVAKHRAIIKRDR